MHGKRLVVSEKNCSVQQHLFSIGIFEVKSCKNVTRILAFMLQSDVVL